MIMVIDRVPNQSMVNHLRIKEFKLDKRLKLQKDSILDIGSNDGTKLFSKYNRIRMRSTRRNLKFYPKSIKVFPKLFNQQSSKFIKVNLNLYLAMFMTYQSLINEKKLKNGIFHVEITHNSTKPFPLIFCRNI